jgi:hypothetical protein
MQGKGGLLTAISPVLSPLHGDQRPRIVCLEQLSGFLNRRIAASLSTASMVPIHFAGECCA